MHPGKEPLIPDTRAVLRLPVIPDHELLCLIGRGAYGEVWMARNAIGTLRAIKIVHRHSFAQADHFEREFRGLLKFEPISRSHDGLVDILQIGRRDEAGYFYYVMELADDAKSEVGRGSESGAATLQDQQTDASRPSTQADPNLYSPHTLRSELHTRGRLSPAECATIGLKLASALQHLHTNGLVHRDIKPSNIIFVKGEPNLADIGLVTAIDEAHSLVGTAGYIPPEGPGTPQADLYSLGKVLYEIAFGKDRQDFPQLPPDLETHPDYTALLELNEIILTACETDPRQRYSSAQEAIIELALLLQGKSVRRVRMTQRRWAAARKLGLTAVAAGLILTALPWLKETKTGHTPNANAAVLYEWGQWHYNQLTPGDHAKALDYLTQAVKADPGFLEPYGEWTALYIWAMLPGLSSQENRLKVKEIADKVLGIDPNRAEGHAALSLYKYLGRDWLGAEAEIVRAVELNPKLGIPHQFYAFYLTMLGRTEEARRESQLADKLAPPEAARISAIVSAWPFMAERRFDLAIVQLKRVVELDRNFPKGRTFLGSCYEAQSNYLAAIEEWRVGDLSTYTNYARVNAFYDALRQAYETQGQEGYLRKWIELTEAEKSVPDDERLSSDADLAGIYALLGDKAKALDVLEEHGVWHRLKFDSLYDPLHDDPRFKALLKRAGLE